MAYGECWVGPTEGQGLPTEFDLDVSVATVALLHVLLLSFTRAVSFSHIIEPLRIHADVVSWFNPGQCKSKAEQVSFLMPAGLSVICVCS